MQSSSYSFHILILSTDFQKKKTPQISNFMNIRPVGPDLCHTDRRTDITKLIVAFAMLRTRLKMYKMNSRMGKQPHNKHVRVAVITVLQKHSKLTRLKLPSCSCRTPSVKRSRFREGICHSSLLVISLLTWDHKAHYRLFLCIRARHSSLP